MVQPADMPLEAGHGGPRLGSVEHVELRKDKRLWIVAELLDGFDLTRQPWQLSYDLIEKQDGYQLHAVAVCERSATTCLPPISVKDGKLYDAARRVTYSDGGIGELVKNVYETQKTRRGGSLLIRDVEREKQLEDENRRREADYRYRSLAPTPTRDWSRVPPQMRQGWRPGGIEWSQAAGRVLSVR